MDHPPSVNLRPLDLLHMPDVPIQELDDKELACPVCFVRFDSREEQIDLGLDHEIQPHHEAAESASQNNDGAHEQPHENPNRTDGVSSILHAIERGSLDTREGSIHTDDVTATDLQHTPVRLPCSHVVGRTCLGLWLASENSDDGRTACPLCRNSPLDERMLLQRMDDEMVGIRDHLGVTESDLQWLATSGIHEEVSRGDGQHSVP